MHPILQYLGLTASTLIASFFVAAIVAIVYDWWINRMDDYPSIEGMEQQLLDAGWVRVTETAWRSPQGATYQGHCWAWWAMKQDDSKHDA